MKILVLGGTRFFGKQLVSELIKAGHEVTIATRGIATDGFGDSIERVVLDRQDKESLSKTLRGTTYDVVYDNICYVTDEVVDLLEVIKEHVGKYIVTSSSSVYDKGYNLSEEAYNPYTYPIKEGRRGDFSYPEGKRQVEATCFQYYKELPIIAVRLPVVIGENDYTNRLRFYIEHIKTQKPFNAQGKDENMNFITEEEAGKFLSLLATAQYTGPINASSHGQLSVSELIGMIEEYTYQEAIVDDSSENNGPYSNFGGVTLNNERAKALGLSVGDVREHFKCLIQQEL